MIQRPVPLYAPEALLLALPDTEAVIPRLVSGMPLEMVLVVTQLDELGMVAGAVGVTVSPTV
jgi:hypothetical protein